MRQFKQLLLLLTFLLFSTVPVHSNAEPWYTGPILAQSGTTMPKGKVDIQPFYFDTRTLGYYNAAGQLEAVPAFRNQSYFWLFFYGLGDDFDMQFTLSYNRNTTLARRYGDIGDVSFLLGWQLWRQQHNSWQPNLRLTIQQTLPSGRHDKFNGMNNSVEATGLGSYQTAITFNFDHQLQIYDDHYLQSYLNLGAVLMTDVRVEGLNTYGGGAGTLGEVSPGTQFFAIASWEYNITQHWVGVFEVFYTRNRATTFTGNLGLTPEGRVASVGNGDSRQLSIVPAIEYNFNKNWGIIGGVWWSLSGVESSRFISTIIALNYYQ